MVGQFVGSQRAPTAGPPERRARPPVGLLSAPAVIGGLGMAARTDLGPSSIDPMRRAAVARLQGSHGNRFTQRLIASSTHIQRCGGAVHAGCSCAVPDGNTAISNAPTISVIGPQRLTATEKEEDLTSSRYAGIPRLESAFDNNPALRSGEKGEAVKAVQQGVIDDGIPMPVSTKKTGAPDGDYGGETVKAVKEFQTKHGLLDGGVADGVVGRRTLRKLDELAGSGPPDKRIGPQTSDLEVTGKFETTDKSPATDKSTIFFKKDDAGFADDDEKAKVAPFFTPADSDLTLTGSTSEEEKNAPALAAARIATVTDALDKGGHDILTHITATPDPTAGRGVIDYRHARHVAITTGKVPAPKSTCEDAKGNPLPDSAPCSTEMEGLLAAAQEQSRPLLGGAIAAVSASPLTDKTLGILDSTFGGNVAGAGKAQAPAVRKRLELIKTQLNGWSKAKAHTCGTPCQPICAQGSPANTRGRGAGPAALLTLCPNFGEFKGVLPADILIHESAHGATGVAADDHAQGIEREINFLPPDKALRNAQSYSNFCIQIATGATARQPAKDTLVGLADSATDKDTDAARRTLARVEKLIGFCSFDMGTLYSRLGIAQKKGSWLHPKVGGFSQVMDLVAPRFSLTPTRTPPSDRDRFAVAAIVDRYRRMDSVTGSELTLTRDPVNPTSWATGPGTAVTLGPEFFAASPDERINLLLAALVKATPGISSGLVPHYVALVHENQRLVHP